MSLIGLRVSLGVVNGAAAPCNDRRFDCVGAFFAAGVNPTTCGGLISGSCVLIAPSTVLIARHSITALASQKLSELSANTYRVRFRRAINGESWNSVLRAGDPCHGVYQEIKVASFIDAPISGSDMVLGILEREVELIRPAPLELNDPLKAGTPIALVGWGYDGTCFGAGEHWTLRYAWGKMPIAPFGDAVIFSPCGITQTAPCLTCPTGGPWITANLHDSGAGIFIEASSPTSLGQKELRLVATVSSSSAGHRLSAWNSAGGQPRVVQSVTQPSTFDADFDRDGVVTSGDLFAYLPEFFTGSCLGDLNGDGVTNYRDLYDYLRVFFAND